MKLARIAAIAMAAASLAAPALAQTGDAPFDPRAYQSRTHGQLTQVLVLGTPHLSGTPDDFDPAVLEPLLDRLAAFDPDVIAIESLSGESLYTLRAYDEIYDGTADFFGRAAFVMAALGRAGTGLDLPEAEAEVRRTLADWPEAPTPAQRRRLAALFAASGDPNSALVQWWRLDPAERKASDELRQPLVDQLEAYAAGRNERHMVAVRLAARLGLERVYPTDDHLGDGVVQAHVDDLTAFMAEPGFRETIDTPAFQRLVNAAKHSATGEEMLETYRFLNSPEAGRLDADGQWLRMIDRPSPNNVGRVRLAGWESRNLRQVAQIREAAAQAPGGRVLVIVGSAHKPWFDAYLGMMTTLEVVDAGAVLR
jgi:hypothetical protein